jgi:hypothetical protein
VVGGGGVVLSLGAGGVVAGGGVVSAGGVAGAGVAAGVVVDSDGVAGWSAGRLLQPPSSASATAAPNTTLAKFRVVISLSFRLKEKVRQRRPPPVP